ncbi:DNA replication terminus site-binding protein [Vreelandella olivaria]|uniref:DNA replication terminus site-binding protein n=1 Tax=Vreelandella olivaria TaxID=390919 RepID=UPI00201EA781|nr:DNA replication terminus site-binding protein [Halomonas olivaria]
MHDNALPLYQLLYELESCFDQLMIRIDQAVTLYEQQQAPTWHFQQPAGSDWLREALLDMWHQQGQDGRETRNYIALIAANEELVAAFNAINLAKTHISELLQRIKQAHPASVNEAKLRLPQRHPHVDDVLRKSGYARLHLKQCWRHIPISPVPVSRVRFAWYTSGRSIKKMTVQEAEHRLLQLDTDAPHIRIQLRRLASIPSSEPLAQVQSQAPLLRANLFFTEPLADGHTRQAMNIALPLIVPGVNRQLPDIKVPPLEPPTQRTRARRRDEKLEHEAFLPSLRIYRYR